MIYRPDIFRVVRTAGVGLVIWLGAASMGEMPLILRVVSVIFVLLTPVYVWVSLRTRIWVRASDVEVRTTHDTETFHVGSSSVKSVSLPDGLYKSSSALEFKGSGNKTMVIPLHSFSLKARGEVLAEVSRVLSTSGSSE